MADSSISVVAASSKFSVVAVACTASSVPSVRFPDTNLVYGIKFKVVKSATISPENSPRTTSSTAAIVIFIKLSLRKICLIYILCRPYVVVIEQLTTSSSDTGIPSRDKAVAPCFNGYLRY